MTITQLLAAVASATGGLAEFYSVPEGRGCQARRDEEGYMLAASSLDDAQTGEMASEELSHALETACSDDSFADRSVAVSSVRTSFGLEGCLLLRAAKAHEWTASIGALELLPALSIWALTLAERLEAVNWRVRAEAAMGALKNMRHAVDRAVLEEENAKSMTGTLLEALKEHPLNKEVRVDGVRVYMCGYGGKCRLRTQSTVPETQVHLNAGRPLVQEAASTGSIVYVPNLYKDPRVQVALGRQPSGAASASREEKAQFMLCVPIDLPPTPFRIGSTAVMQLTSSASSLKRDANWVDHFDVLSAEVLQEDGILQEVLQVNDCLSLHRQYQTQRRNAEKMIAEVDSCPSITDVVERVQELVPQVFCCGGCTLFFLDEEIDELWSLPFPGQQDGIRFELGEGIVGEVAKNVVEGDEEDIDIEISNEAPTNVDWRGPPGAPKVYNIMTAPICTGSPPRLLCVIQVINKFSVDAEFCICGQQRKAKHILGMSSRSLGAPRVCENCGEVAEEFEACFTERDKQLFQYLAEGLGNCIKFFLTDIMWLKARMDNLQQDCGEDDESFRAEYYSVDAQPSKVTRVTTRRQTFSKRSVSLALGVKTASANDLDSMTGQPRKTIRMGRSRADIRNWSVDYWSLTAPEEFHFFWQGFEMFSTFDQLNVEKGVLYQFFLAVKRAHRPNPYHNFRHALSTVHYSVKLLDAAGLVNLFPITYRFALIIGAMVHDVDHRGRNNAFEIVTKSELAVRYNDMSPLEHHHCAKAFELALFSNDNERNIFKDLSAEEYTEVRGAIVRAVLATDMKNHGHHCQEMQEFQLDYDNPPGQCEFLLELIVHMADIGNQMMPSEIASRWQKHLSDEFVEQVNAEQRLGLPVTGFMVGLAEPITEAKSRLGFIEFVVYPLASSIFRCFPSGLEAPRGNIEENRNVALAIIDTKANLRETSKPRKTRIARSTIMSKQPITPSSSAASLAP